MIGQRIKALRNEANLTQQELADGIISRTYLSLIEKNSVYPSMNVLKKLSERLNCTLEDFTLEDNDRSISLLSVKREIKWAENQVIVGNFAKLESFLEQRYDTLDTLSKEERAIALWVKASFLFNEEKYNDAEQVVLKSIALAKGLKDVTLKLRCLELLGKISFNKGEKDTAIHHLNKANNIAILENIFSTERVSILTSLAQYYSRIGEFYVAINLSNEALDYNKKLKMHYKSIELENILGRSYRALGKLDEAEHHFKRAVMHCELSEINFDYVGSISNVALLLNTRGLYDEAYQEILKANEVLDKYQFKHPFSKYIRLHLAEILINKDKFEEAAEVLEQYADQDDTGYGYELIGDIEYKIGAYEKAIEWYEQSLTCEDLPFYSIDILKKISNIYELQGNFEKSNEYLKKCIEIYKEIAPDMI